MNQPPLTHEARCLVVLAGGVLERCIEDYARKIAHGRATAEIGPDDVKKATTEFFNEELPGLPRLIEQAIDQYQHQTRKAA